MPSYQRLKTMVRRHIDQMIRTRNFKAQNERIETGVLVNSHKGRNVSVERRENAISGKQLDSVQKETLVVSATEIVDRQHNRPLLLQKRGHRLTEENPRKDFGLRGESPSGMKGQTACKKKNL